MQPTLGRFGLEKILDGGFDSRSHSLQEVVVIQFLATQIRNVKHVGHLIQSR